MPADRCDLLCLDLPRAEALRHRRLDRRSAELYARRVGALADPTRLTIAAALRDGGELCVCDVGWIVERSQALVSHHLRALHDAGLVSSRRDRRMVLYTLTADGLELMDATLAVMVAV